MSYLLRDARKRNWFWGERGATALLENANERSVYLALLEIDYGTGLIFASQQTIADRAKVSLSTVQRTLPRLEAKRLLERADSDTLSELAEEIGRYPAAVVYLLRNAEPEAKSEKAPAPTIAPGLLVGQVRGAIAELPVDKRWKPAITVIARFLQQNGIDAPFGWLKRMWDQAFSVLGSDAAADILARAAIATVRNKPGGKPMAYMNTLVREYTKRGHLAMDGKAEAKDLSAESTAAFSWGEEDA